MKRMEKYEDNDEDYDSDDESDEDGNTDDDDDDDDAGCTSLFTSFKCSISEDQRNSPFQVLRSVAAALPTDQWG